MQPMDHDDVSALEARMARRMRKERTYGLIAGAALVLSISAAWSGTARRSASAYPVTIDNTWNSSVPTHNVDDPAHDPFTITLGPTLFEPATFLVPPHKRLVLTTVSASVPYAEVYCVVIQGTTAAHASTLTLPLSSQFNGNDSLGTQSVTQVFDAGSQVKVSLRALGEGDWTCEVDLQGYYVDENGYYSDTGY
jgi:hypothetical protein